MPALIETSDPSSREPPRKKRRLSADEEVAGSCKRRRHLEDVDVSDPRRPISKQELIYNWLSESGWSRQRETWNEMPQLPSPSISGSAASKKSTASVHDTNYRQTLQLYNIYVKGKKAPPELVEQAMEIISRKQKTEIDDATMDRLRETVQELVYASEEEVKNSLAAVIIPGFNDTRINEKLQSALNQLWTKTVPIPLDRKALKQPLPLPKPKPDIAFGYTEAAFDESQLLTLPLLVKDPGESSFASPSDNLRFPFLVVELKSEAANAGSLNVAKHQAAGAGAIAMNGFMELMARDFRLGELDPSMPLFFSVTMNQTIACLNVHWMGKKTGSDQPTFHLQELKVLPLGYDDSIRVLQRAVKNIFDHAEGERLKLVLDALKGYREKYEAQRDAQDEMKSHPPPSPPQPPSGSKKVKRTVEADGNGLAAHEAPEGSIEQRTPSSRMSGPRQAGVKPSGVRTRPRSNLSNPK